LRSEDGREQSISKQQLKKWKRRKRKRFNAVVKRLRGGTVVLAADKNAGDGLVQKEVSGSLKQTQNESLIGRKSGG